MNKLLIPFFFILIICSGSILFSSPEKKGMIALGKQLFSEKILSKDSSVSCASCHLPAYAFADTVPFSKGIEGRFTKRNTPSVLNMKNRPYYFWDGRAPSLEKQSLMPIENPDEMGLSIGEAVKRLNASPIYLKAFKKVFHKNPDAPSLAASFAAYENTLETLDSKFDDWSNNIGKLTAQEESGRQLFIGKAKCFGCHSMEDFTDDGFKNIGLFDSNDLNDGGRFVLTGNKEDLGKFKTPGLRNIGVTGPYMHNGMFKTLEQVLAYYNMPKHFIDQPINIDPTLKNGLSLSTQEKKDIISFMLTLTDKQFTNR